ncbi:hypothetical protein FO519_001629 [Halicephalobus sp. NKZ332]|nr:hypothetical protein FO519_001629 [Halicephalobus sp. NKZ332]
MTTIRREIRTCRKSARNELCRVCSDKAHGIHFGVMVCRACAAFYRRTILINIVYHCRFGRNCPIEKSVRCMCRSCRYAKCIKVGMRIEAYQQSRDSVYISHTLTPSKSLSSPPLISSLNSQSTVKNLDETELELFNRINVIFDDAMVNPRTLTELTTLEMFRLGMNHLRARRAVVHTECLEDPDNYLGKEEIVDVIANNWSKIPAMVEREVYLYAELLAFIKPYVALSPDQRWILYKQFVISFMRFERAYEIYRVFGDNREDRRCVMFNGQPINYSLSLLNELEFHKRKIANHTVFPLLRKDMDMVMNGLVMPMKEIKPSEIEFAALCLHLLWLNPCVNTVTDETEKLALDKDLYNEASRLYVSVTTAKFYISDYDSLDLISQTDPNSTDVISYDTVQKCKCGNVLISQNSIGVQGISSNGKIIAYNPVITVHHPKSVNDLHRIPYISYFMNNSFRNSLQMSRGDQTYEKTCNSTQCVIYYKGCSSDPLICSTAFYIVTGTLLGISILISAYFIILSELKNSNFFFKCMPTWFQDFFIAHNDGRIRRFSFLYTIIVLVLNSCVLFFGDRHVLVNNTACEIMAGVHYFLFLSIMFVLMQSVFILTNVVGGWKKWYSFIIKCASGKENKLLHMFYSLLIPLVLTGVFGLTMKDFFNRNDDFCWVRQDYIFASMWLPIILVFLPFFLYIPLLARCYRNNVISRHINRCFAKGGEECPEVVIGGDQKIINSSLDIIDIVSNQTIGTLQQANNNNSLLWYPASIAYLVAKYPGNLIHKTSNIFINSMSFDELCKRSDTYTKTMEFCFDGVTPVNNSKDATLCLNVPLKNGVCESKANKFYVSMTPAKFYVFVDSNEGLLNFESNSADPNSTTIPIYTNIDSCHCGIVLQEQYLIGAEGIDEQLTKFNYNTEVTIYHSKRVNDLHRKPFIARFVQDSFQLGKQLSRSSTNYRGTCDSTHCGTAYQGCSIDPLVCSTTLHIIGGFIAAMSTVAVIIGTVYFISQNGRAPVPSCLRLFWVLASYFLNSCLTKKTKWFSFFYILTVTAYMCFLIVFGAGKVISSDTSCGIIAAVNYFLFLSCVFLSIENIFVMSEAMNHWKPWYALFIWVCAGGESRFLPLIYSFGLSLVITGSFGLKMTDFYHRSDGFCWVRPDYQFVSLWMPLIFLLLSSILYIPLFASYWRKSRIAEFINSCVTKEVEEETDSESEKTRSLPPDKIISHLILPQFLLALPVIFESATLYLTYLSAWSFLFIIVVAGHVIILILVAAIIIVRNNKEATNSENSEIAHPATSSSSPGRSIGMNTENSTSSVRNRAVSKMDQATSLNLTYNAPPTNVVSKDVDSYIEEGIIDRPDLPKPDIHQTIHNTRSDSVNEHPGNELPKIPDYENLSSAKEKIIPPKLPPRLHPRISKK